MARCEWGEDAVNKKYHDEEWGVPLHDDMGSDINFKGIGTNT